MLVNAYEFPAPAMWQGLMFIVVAIWAVLLTQEEIISSKKADIFLAVATILVSVFVATVFGGK
jgi:hypothetical protein